MHIKKTPIAINASGLKVGLAISRFNEQITNDLLEQAKRRLQACQVRNEDVAVVSVAGSIELPFALLQLAQTKKFDCLVALGAVIKGETPHFDYVCKTAQEGILQVSLDHQIPIGFGIITAYDFNQARERTGLGSDAVDAALELAQLKV